MAINKTWNATVLTGGVARSLDAIPIASLTDGDRSISIVSGELYIHEFDSTSTDAENSPSKIRPDDYSTSGVWILAESPLDLPIYSNLIINGNFDIWQRDISQTVHGYGSDDRWSNSHGTSTKTVSRQTFTLGQVEVPDNPIYFSRTVVTTGGTAASSVAKMQKVEGVHTLSGKTGTLSFYAKADASRNMSVEFLQQFGTGGSPSALVNALGVTKFALTTSWQKLSVSVDLPSISGKTLGTDENDSLQARLWFDAGSDFDARTDTLGNQSGTFDIAQVQLEVGSSANPFDQRSVGEELLLCQRYFEKSYDFDVPVGSIDSNGIVRESATRNSDTLGPGFKFSVKKRNAPTCIIYSPDTGDAGKSRNGTDKATIAENIGDGAAPRVNITGGVLGSALTYHWDADAELAGE